MPATALGPFRFDLTVEEVHALATRVHARAMLCLPQRAWWQTIAGVCGLLAIVVALFLAGLVSRDMAWLLIVAGVLGMGAGQLALMRETRQVARRAMTEWEQTFLARFDQVSITLRHDAAAFATPSLAASLRWDMLVEAEVADKMLFLWTEGGLALVIPERVFRDMAERDEALSFARRHVGKARLPVQSDRAAP